MALTIKEVAEIARSMGLSVTLTKQGDRFRVTEINGVKYRSSESFGNNQLRQYVAQLGHGDALLSPSETKQRSEAGLNAYRTYDPRKQTKTHKYTDFQTGQTVEETVKNPHYVPSATSRQPEDINQNATKSPKLTKKQRNELRRINRKLKKKGSKVRVGAKQARKRLGQEAAKRKTKKTGKIKIEDIYEEYIEHAEGWSYTEGIAAMLEMLRAQGLGDWADLIYKELGGYKRHGKQYFRKKITEEALNEIRNLAYNVRNELPTVLNDMRADFLANGHSLEEWKGQEALFFKALASGSDDTKFEAANIWNSSLIDALREGTKDQPKKGPLIR